MNDSLLTLNLKVLYLKVTLNLKVLAPFLYRYFGGYSCLQDHIHSEAVQFLSADSTQKDHVRLFIETSTFIQLDGLR